MSNLQSKLEEIQFHKVLHHKVITAQKNLISDLERDEKAYALLDGVNIIPEDNIAIVTSGKKVYKVDYHGKVCECPDHTYRHVDCKHIRAVNIVLFQMDAKKVGVTN